MINNFFIVKQLFICLSMLGWATLPAQAACLSHQKVAVFADCISVSIEYQLNEGGDSIKRATREAVKFCYSRIAN